MCSTVSGMVMPEIWHPWNYLAARYDTGIPNTSSGKVKSPVFIG